MPSSIEDRLTKIEGKIEKLLEKARGVDDLIHNQQILHKNVTEFKKDFESYCAHNDNLIKEVAELKKSVHSLQAENINLKQDIKDLRASSEESICSRTASDMEITGIPITPGENLKQTFQKVLSKIAVPIIDSDIIDVSRKTSGKNRNEIIYVKLRNQTLRDSAIMNGRKSRLRTADLGFSGNNVPIYFNEPLSVYARKLFYQARKLKVDLGYKFAWVKRGKIYVRKTEKESAILITSLTDLITLRA